MPESTVDYADKFAGCLVGFAIGEALGSPLESKSRAEISSQYSQPVRDYLPFNNTTLQGNFGLNPNTFMMLLQAESLVRTGGAVLASDFGPAMLAALDLPIVGQFGKTTRESLQNVRSTGDYQSGSASEDTADNEAACRVAPLGLLYSYGEFVPGEFRQACASAARLTHNNSVAIQAAVAVAGAVRAMCRHEIMPEDLMALALDLIPPGYLDLPLAGNPLRQKLLAAQDYIEERQTFVDNVLANDLDVDIFRVDLKNMLRCGISSYAPETVAAAFYAFVAQKDSFEEALVLAINPGGATSATGAITGAIAGAYHGLAAIPERWRQGLPGYAKIVESAQALHALAANRAG